MKRACLFLLAASLAFGQAAFRVDPSPAFVTGGNTPFGGASPIYVVPGATIALCQDAACTTPATAFTNGAGNTACPINAPVTLAGTSNCVNTTSSTGTFGFWVSPGTYYYTIALPGGTTMGSFPLSVGGGGGGGGIGYPPAGVPNSTGFAWGPSYTVGAGPLNIPQLNGNGYLIQSILGNAATASAFATVPQVCSVGQAPIGILANGNATGCAAIGGGGSMTWPSTAGLANYNGSNAWGTSYTVGTAANNIPQLNGSGQLTVNTTGSAASLSANLPVSNLNGGSGASSTTYWRGDGSWATPATGSSSSWNALSGCVPTVASPVITLPTTCTISTGPTSLGVAAPVASTFTWTSTDGIINIGYDNGQYYVWTTTTGTCGSGFSCVPATSNYPNGVLKIAHLTVASGILGSIVLDMTASQNKVTYTGQDIARTWSGGAQVVNGTFLRNPRYVSGATDTLTNSDCGNMVVYSNSSAIAVTLPQAAAGGNFVAGCEIAIDAQGTGNVTITPTTSTINGTATYTASAGGRYYVNSDGTNYVGSGGGSGGGGTAVSVTFPYITIAGAKTSANLAQTATPLTSFSGWTNLSASTITTATAGATSEILSAFSSGTPAFYGHTWGSTTYADVCFTAALSDAQQFGIFISDSTPSNLYSISYGLDGSNHLIEVLQQKWNGSFSPTETDTGRVIFAGTKPCFRIKVNGTTNIQFFYSADEGQTWDQTQMGNYTYFAPSKVGAFSVNNTGAIGKALVVHYSEHN